MSTYNVHAGTVPFTRHPMSKAHALLRLTGYVPAGYCDPVPAPEMRRALHGLDAVCLFLVSHYLLRPLMALREWIRPRTAAGDFLATTAEPMTHDLMLGLFSIPGVRWSLALVMQGENREATRVLAWKMIKTDHEACMATARRSIGEARCAQIERGRGLVNRLCGMALALGVRS
jgi:hypothetical protein